MPKIKILKIKMRKGFTLVEVLVVIGVTALISSFVISYSNQSRRQVALQIETQKIGNLILAAKAAAIATLDTPARKAARDAAGRILCGYGFEIDYNSAPQSYRIFSYEPQASSCDNITAIRQQDRFSVPTALLPTSSSTVPSGVILSNDSSVCGSPCDSLYAVLFVPPSPDTVLSRLADGAVVPGESQYHIYLMTTDGSARREIEVNSAGQVDF